ncbi:unnamed protein product [Chondrus crispus]|uniref:Secreted protein n=1 Tax=Chondrus crispus TaxID=2769 RepID=R7QBB4_CHOCR|nr:unnamed protein product [Chondrus crispus]CDF35359.1 unnamed protein product [Chondrus crispus]|eukprot:XP_005715178.1 unnamed protein product [Chondrus crispus]
MSTRCKNQTLFLFFVVVSIGPVCHQTALAPSIAVTIIQRRNKTFVYPMLPQSHFPSHRNHHIGTISVPYRYHVFHSHSHPHTNSSPPHTFSTTNDMLRYPGPVACTAFAFFRVLLTAPIPASRHCLLVSELALPPASALIIVRAKLINLRMSEENHPPSSPPLVRLLSHVTSSPCLTTSAEIGDEVCVLWPRPYSIQREVYRNSPEETRGHARSESKSFEQQCFVAPYSAR